MGRGEKKQASPLGFSYTIFDSSHSYQRWFLAGCSGSKSSNHSPYFLILAAVSHRQCYCQMLKRHPDLRKKETAWQGEWKQIISNFFRNQRASLENRAGLHFHPRFGNVSILLPFLNFVLFSYRYFEKWFFLYCCAISIPSHRGALPFHCHMHREMPLLNISMLALRR